MLKNQALGEERQGSMDTSLKERVLYANVELPSDCIENGRSLHDSAQVTRIDMAKVARGLFKDGEIPSYAFVSNIDVVSGIQSNNEGRRLSFSVLPGTPEMEGCGRFCTTSHCEYDDDFVTDGTFLIMGDNAPVVNMKQVYDASSFTSENSIFTRYSSALEHSFEDNLSEIKETGSFMYTSIFNDNEVVEDFDPEDSSSAEAALAAQEPIHDFFLGLVFKNVDSLSQIPVVHKRPGKLHKYVYTIDIAAADVAALRASAHENIFEPMENHLISLKMGGSKHLKNTFDIIVRSESRKVDGDERKWADQTNLNLTLAVTFAYFEKKTTK
jgi:hypothetical protein